MERYKLDSHEDTPSFNVSDRYPETSGIIDYGLRIGMGYLRTDVYNAAVNLLIPVWQAVKEQSSPVDYERGLTNLLRQ